MVNLSRNVFVFSDRRNHLHTLAIMLQKHNIDFEAPELEDEKQTIKTEESELPENMSQVTLAIVFLDIINLLLSYDQLPNLI